MIAGGCRDWAMITLAAEPGEFARTAIASVARHDRGIEAGDLLVAGIEGVREYMQVQTLTTFET